MLPSLSISALAIAPWLFSTLAAAELGVLHLPLRRREVENPEHPAKLRKRQTTGTAQATIFNAQANLLYLINTTVGTPPESIELQLDTGSSDIWFPWAGSTQCSRADRCDTGSYDASTSSTYVDVLADEFLISYVDGTVIRGDYINETFGVAGIDVLDQTMGLAKSAEEPGAGSNSNFQGIMGVGFDIGTAIYYQSSGQIQYPNIISQMVIQGKIATRAYSLWLNDLESPEGNILFGGIDNAKFNGDLTILPLQADADSGNIDSFTVVLAGLNITGAGDRTVYSSTDDIPVILDSGTTLTYLPDNIANAIMSGVGAVDNSNYGVVVPCELGTTAGHFLFQFGNTANGPVIRAEISQFVLPFPASYSTPRFRDGRAACRWGILPSGDNPNLFGDTFLRSAYVVYNIEGNEIGIAQTNFNVSDTEIKQITVTSSLPGATSTATGEARQTRTGPVQFTNGIGGVTSGADATATAGTFDLGSPSSNGGSASSSAAAAGVMRPSQPIVGAVAAGVTVLVGMVAGGLLVLA